MASLQIQEHFQDENAVPNKQARVVKRCSVRSKKRAVLQPLGNIQQNTRRAKETTGIEKPKITNKPEEKKVDKLPEPITDIIALKPIFRRNNLTCRSSSIEQEYEEEIWDYLKLLEERSFHHIKPNYMDKQSFLTWDMRSTVVDWLVNVAEDYKMSDHTIHLSVNYLDRFLSNLSVIREKFQLVGATAMLLASKVEEIYPPDIKEWSYLTGSSFTPHQIVKMEQLMLRVLKFEMNVPTILDFIKHLCAKHKLDSKTMFLAQYLSELVLLEGENYLQHIPSELAAASLYLARHYLNKSKPWTQTLQETAGYTVRQLSPVVQRQHKTFNSSPFKEHQTIQKKYASDKYQKVSLLKPKILVMEFDDDEE